MSTVQPVSRQYFGEWEQAYAGSYFVEVPTPSQLTSRDSENADSKDTDLTIALVYCDVMMTNLLGKGIALPNPEDIRRNLLCHADMTDLVKRICDDALDRFPKPSQVALELYKDPEIEDEHLTVYVRQYHYDDNILDVIDDVRLKFEEERASSSSRIHITTDFEPPI